MALPHLVRNTFFQAFAKLVSVVGGVVLVYFLGQRFGESGFGVYTFVMSFVLFFGSLSDWGTSFIAVREASKLKDVERQKIFTTSLITRLILSLVGFVIINILVRVNPSWKDFTLTTTVASLVLYFLSLKTSLSIIFQTKLRFDLISLVEVVSTMVFVSLSVFFVSEGGGINMVMLAWVISAGFSFFLSVILLGKFPAPLYFDRGTACVILKESFPTGALLVVSTIYNRVDIVILQHFHTTADVGIYGMAYKVYETAVFGAAYVMNAMFPLLSKMYSSGSITTQMKTYFGKSFLGLFLTGVVVALLAFILAPYLPIMFKGKFDFSVVPLKILSFALVFSYLNHLIGYTLIAFGRQKTALFVAVVALFFNVSLNLLFVPQFSYTASAYLTIATEALVLLVSGLVILKNIFKCKVSF